MPVPTETELKFELDAADVDKLMAHPLLRKSAGPKRLTSVYFDTDDFALREAGVSLRVRHGDGQRLQTIKASHAGGVFSRAEWERAIDGNQPDPASFAGTPLEALADGDLRPLFETRVDRTAHLIKGKGWAVEISLDRAEVDTGQSTADFVELELELKEGGVAHLFDLARSFNKAAPLRLAMRSKAGRGYELVDGPPKVAKSEPLDLDRRAGSGEAFRAIGRECMRHLTANVPIFIASGAPEAVHQMRVAIRRLRAAMSLFKDMVADDRVEAVKGELKWIAGEFGRTRNLDVFIRDVLGPLREHHPNEPGMEDLGAYFGEQRQQAYADASKAVRSPRFNTALIETAAWIETGPWSDNGDALRRAKLDLPVATLAADEFTRRRQAIKRKGRKLAQLDVEARHKLRIRIKKVRYATEFFASLYGGQDGKRRKKFAAALEALQDHLGELNDLAVNHDIEVDLALRPRKKARGHAARRAFAAGMITGHQFSRINPLIESAAGAYGKFRQAEPFW